MTLVVPATLTALAISMGVWNGRESVEEIDDVEEEMIEDVSS